MTEKNYSEGNSDQYKIGPFVGEEAERNLRRIVKAEGFVEAVERAVDDFEHGRGIVYAAGERPGDKK